MLRHTFVTTMLDAGVDLRDVQIAARHADPRTTMRYDNPRELHRMGEIGEGSPADGREGMLLAGRHVSPCDLGFLCRHPGRCMICSSNGC